ncbi:hypothetical protein [Halalkalicoccus paucihalophilus]|nr:hypothetical protein [Halalkalicoccus paucihalophilus]
MFLPVRLWFAGDTTVDSGWVVDGTLGARVLWVSKAIRTDQERWVV